MQTTLLWFRQDLRLQDNPTLHAALARGGAIVPVYVLDDAGEGRWPIGGAARWWLHHSLAALDGTLRERGSRLVFSRGDSAAELKRLARATDATAVYWNRRYEPAVTARDTKLEQTLVLAGLEAKVFASTLLHEPGEVANKQGRPFQVFTPFWRHCLTLPVLPPLKLAPSAGLPGPAKWPASLALDELELLPERRWADGFAAAWWPGEAAAREQLLTFSRVAMDAYSGDRDRPDHEGTSRLSAALHFGEITPRQVWAAVKARSKDSGVFPPSAGARVFLNEIGWREFAYHLLTQFPHTPEMPLRHEFARFPWAADADGSRLRSWQRGQTGYPIVDAGMRQLWATGWMHNRVRMIAASFLVKHLRLPWTGGAAWFWDTLVDADLASNTLGWQWSAGCGADAAPYFRIFAPVTQGKRFDPDGVYVRRWVPDLARMPAEQIHAPWEVPPRELEAAGVRLGETYPRPIVDHATARTEALAALKNLRRGGSLAPDADE